VADNEQHRATLQDLNRNYIRSVDEANVAWFDANLAGGWYPGWPAATPVIGSFATELAMRLGTRHAPLAQNAAWWPPANSLSSDDR
jgi:hypothetical protein